MTVVLDWKTADPTCPDPPVRCSFCDSPIHPPFVHWMCNSDADICICARCCSWCRHGLMADMMRTTAINEGLNPSPDCPTMRMIQ
jgi:hypothetical protein